MNDPQLFLQSGITERYVLNQTTPAEDAEVARMAALFPEVQEELEAMTIALEQYASAHAQAPDPGIKIFLLATINYMSRLEAGEQPTVPPLLRPGSRISDYAPWLERPDLQLADEEEDARAYIIGHTPEALTAIVWLKRGALPEEHNNEYEHFLVVEGTCAITIGEEVHYLSPGDYLAIPLFTPHSVHVTSAVHCKVILQRVAA
jgi:mannose-6-phosphate isomerase-like protein (cupin superfamily)